MLILSHGQVLLLTLSPNISLLLFQLRKSIWSRNSKNSVQPNQFQQQWNSKHNIQLTSNKKIKTVFLQSWQRNLEPPIPISLSDIRSFIVAPTSTQLFGMTKILISSRRFPPRHTMIQKSEIPLCQYFPHYLKVVINKISKSLTIRHNIYSNRSYLNIRFSTSWWESVDINWATDVLWVVFVHLASV